MKKTVKYLVFTAAFFLLRIQWLPSGTGGR